MARRPQGEGTTPRHRADGRWEARYTDTDGKRRSVYGTTKRAATDALRTALADTAQGIRPPDLRITTADYLNDWLEHYVRPKVRPTTAASYSLFVNRYLIPEIGRVPLAQLQPEHVSAMLRKLEARSRSGKLSPTTIRYAYSVLRIALGRAMKLGRVHRNVATLIDPPAKARRELQPFDALQISALLQAVSGDRLAPLYVAAVGTGLRQGELLGLRWTDLDLDNGVAAVRNTLQRVTGELTEPKTPHARRIVPLPAVVVASLREHRKRQLEERIAAGKRWKDRDLAFATSIGTALDPRNVTRNYHAALVTAGLPRLPFHHLRHAFATFQLEGGEELANVSKLLGHADLSTTADLYAHLTPTTQRRAADRMDRILTG